jgi:hypothetical protein
VSPTCGEAIAASWWDRSRVYRFVFRLHLQLLSHEAPCRSTGTPIAARTSAVSNCCSVHAAPFARAGVRVHSRPPDADISCSMHQSPSRNQRGLGRAKHGLGIHKRKAIVRSAPPQRIPMANSID